MHLDVLIAATAIALDPLPRNPELLPVLRTGRELEDDLLGVERGP